jgi:hypothetical protein
VVVALETLLRDGSELGETPLFGIVRKLITEPRQHAARGFAQTV